MRMRESKNSKKITLAIIGGVVLLLAGGYFVWYQFGDQIMPKNNQAESDSRLKDIPTMPQDPENPKKQVPKQYEGQGDDEDSNTSSDQITGFINSKEVSNDNFSLRLTINQLLGSGTCTLTMTNQKTVTKTAEIVQNPSSSSCKGFDVPVSELGSGEWSIKINIKSGDKTGVIEDKFKIGS